MSWMMKVFTIDCSTGCSCCSSDNHRLGFYRSKADATKRIARFLDPSLEENPVGSQYARKGHYTVMENDAESISGNRIIVNDRVYSFTEFATVSDDGTVIGEERLFS